VDDACAWCVRVHAVEGEGRGDKDFTAIVESVH
jgi:AhpD family alkylhydroperoxidase